MSLAGTCSTAFSQVSGVKLVLYWIMNPKMGARLSPIGCQLIVASFWLHSTLRILGAFGTSGVQKTSLLNLLPNEKNVIPIFGINNFFEIINFKIIDIEF